jgi:hypothetical protein
MKSLAEAETGDPEKLNEATIPPAPNRAALCREWWGVAKCGDCSKLNGWTL